MAADCGTTQDQLRLRPDNQPLPLRQPDSLRWLSGASGEAMRRHSKAGDGPRRRKTAPKHSRAPKPARRRRSSAPSPAAMIARLKRELNEASELQKATSDVLRVIASPTGDIERVFETILANAVRVCDAYSGAINRWDGETLQLIATHNMPPAFAELRMLAPHPDE